MYTDHPAVMKKRFEYNLLKRKLDQWLRRYDKILSFAGHTHIQFDRMVAGKRIINAGSVGLQSRAAGACWALLGPDVELKVTPYDTKAASERILKSNAPYKEDFADHYLNPPYEGP